MRFPLSLCMFFFTLSLCAQNVSLRSQVPLNSMPVNASSGSDIWGFTDPNGREYAIMTTNRGTVFYDITDPDNPAEVGSVSGSTSIWRDVKVYTYDNTPENYSAYAFITTEAPGAGIQIVDLSDVPNSVSLAATYNGFNNVHNILMEPEPTSPFAYICGSNQAGLVILDVSDPVNPTKRGSWANYYVHDFYVGTTWADPEFNGREIGLAFAGSNNLSILDLTDKDNPTLIEDYVYPGLTYCHSGWMSDDGRYAYVCDELDERQLGTNTKIFVLDLIDLNAPVHVATYVGPNRSIDHNIFYKDGFLHMSNYEDGYTLLDASDPVNLIRYGNYDTFPSGSSASFDGAWGVYPYYASGNVAVSDSNTGLYILTPEITPSFNLSGDTESFTVCPEQSAVLNVSLAAQGGFSNAVTLSVPDLPAGVSLEWSQNPILPGQDARLTLTLQPEAVVGNYPLIVNGSGAGVDDQALNFNLEILAGVDQAPSYTSPAQDDSCEGLTAIEFSWENQGLNRTYHFELADNPNFKNPLVQTSVNEARYVLSETLINETSYFWRVRTQNPCGMGEYGDVRHMVAGYPHLLLVDDDDNSPDVQPFYRDALDGLSIPYAVFETNGSSSPSSELLARHDWVIWFSGDDFANDNGLTDAEEATLAAYLDQGGRLLLSAQDYFFDQGTITSFMSSYLGIESIRGEGGTFTSLDGQGSLASLGTIDVSDPVGQKLFDALTLNANGQSILASGNTVAAVETANTVFMGFTFETMIDNDPSKASQLLQHYLNAYEIGTCTLSFGVCGTRDRQQDGFDMGDFLARTVLWSSEESLFSLIDLVDCL